MTFSFLIQLHVSESLNFFNAMFKNQPVGNIEFHLRSAACLQGSDNLSNKCHQPSFGRFCEEDLPGVASKFLFIF